MQEKYIKQVALLVKCLPIIATEECFAIKGGTAINLFFMNLPRLSVDIDLVYLPIESRDTTYQNINQALERISQKLQKIGLKVTSNRKNEQKLICSDGVSDIKIEPNYTLRGYVFEPQLMELCPKAQDLFGYAEARIISEAELWGGKICAALDRQHPRDLFDIYNLLNTIGINSEIKNGFISLLLAGNRPLHEMLKPNFQMDEDIFDKEFAGMTDEIFTFDEAKRTFLKLVENIHTILTEEDKRFLLDFVQLKANLQAADISNLDKLPGIKWKLKNLENLQNQNPEKFQEQYDKLKISF
ncbi:MAG: nucleotidyl transferase AbiEii/AbiGii toxin family protein [Acetobacter sp.]|nr:nucleotidyl transferase AbiEii/AbiGii toxin family protein [Acetobacter sp.]